jgi:ABC-type multidrug transport system permease subunit
MIRALYGLKAILRKEFMHIRRERSTLVFALGIPMMQMLLFGYAVNYDVRYVRTVVLDQDRSRESREYLASLNNTHYLQIVGAVSTPDAAATALRNGSARVAVIVPPDFSQRYGTARPPEVQVLVDGSDSQVANPAIEALQSPTASQNVNIQPRIDVLFNPDSKTAVYTIPGLIAIILQLVTVTLTAFSLVRERESGSLDQLMVTPVGRLALMLGKILPYAALSSCEFLGVLFLARLIFDVPLRGSFLLLAGLSVIFIVCTLSLGLLISTLAKTQGEALQFTMITVLPSILLSGYISPLETLPGPLMILSNIFPVTHFMKITRGIMVRGATFTDLLTPILALCAITVVLIAAATLRFRKTVE